MQMVDERDRKCREITPPVLETPKSAYRESDRGDLLCTYHESLVMTDGKTSWASKSGKLS